MRRNWIKSWPSPNIQPENPSTPCTGDRGFKLQVNPISKKEFHCINASILHRWQDVAAIEKISIVMWIILVCNATTDTACSSNLQCQTRYKQSTLPPKMFNTLWEAQIQ
jgi:hypothetical protein